MSAGAAALVFIVSAFAVLALEILIPFRSAAGDDPERGSTTILPEDR